MSCGGRGAAKCQCVLIGQRGITVSGAGSMTDPIVIDADQVAFEVQDTPSVSALQLGAGEVDDPWVVGLQIPKTVLDGYWKIADSPLADDLLTAQRMYVGADEILRVYEGDVLAAVMRENLVRNPIFGVDTSDWYVDGNITLTRMDDGDGPTGGTWAEMTSATSFPPNFVVGGSGTGQAIATLPASTDIRGSIFVRPSSQVDIMPVLNERDGGGSQLEQTLYDPVTCPAGVWTRLTFEDTTRSDVVNGGVRVAVVEGFNWSGFSLGVGGMMVELAEFSDIGYYDGIWTPDGTPSLWTGTPHDSSSKWWSAP